MLRKPPSQRGPFAVCLQYFKKGQRFPAAWAGCAVPGVRGLFGRGLFAVGGRLNVLLAAGGIPGGFFAAGGVLGVADLGLAGASPGGRRTHHREVHA